MMLSIRAAAFSLAVMILLGSFSNGQEIAINNRHEVQANTFTYSSQSAPAIAKHADGSFVVVWHSRRQQEGTYGIYLQRFSADGRPVGSEQQVNLFTKSMQMNPTVATDSVGGTWVAWESFGQDNSFNAIIARRFSGDDFVGSDELLVNQFTEGNQTQVVAACDHTDSVTFVWTTQNETGDKKQIVTRSFDSAGQATSGERVIAESSQHQNLPCIASASGTSVVVWSELDRFGKPAGLYGSFLSSSSERFRIDSETGSYGIEPVVSMNHDGSFAVAWLNFSQGEYEVVVRKYDDSATPTQTVARASVPGARNVSGAAIEFISENRFVVAWNQQTDKLGRNQNMFAQIFDGDGKRYGSIFPVNKNVEGDHRLTAASGQRRMCWDDKNQQFYVAWSGQSQADKTSVNVTAFVQDRREAFAFSKPEASSEGKIESTARPHEPPTYDPKLIAEEPFGGFEPLGPAGPDFGFVGINATGWNPPDPVLAVGPSHIVAMTNGAIVFFDKSGNVTFSDQIEGAGGFWGAQGATGFVFDPEVLFDPHSNRFFAMANERSSNNRSLFLLAVSDDDDPNGTWFRYRLDVTNLADNNIDSPNMGIDDEAVYLTADFFGPDRYLVFMLRKSDLLVGNTPQTTDLLITGSQSYGIPVMYDADAPAFYMIQAFEFGNFSSVRMHAITDSLTNPQRVTADVAVPAYGHPQDPFQMGTSTRPELFEARFWSCVYRDGSLWAVHHHSPNSTGTARARWYEFEMNGWPTSGQTPQLVQSGELTPTNDKGTTSSTFFPSIWVDDDGNAAITTARSSPFEFISMSRAVRAFNDAANTFQDIQLVRPSTSGFLGGRWGDYSGTNSDPAETGAFWGIHEFTQSSTVWQTYIAKYVVEPAFELIFPSTGDVERGTIVSGQVSDLQQSDNKYLSILAESLDDSDGEEIAAILNSNTVNTTFDDLTFIIETSSNTPNVAQNIELFNFITQEYELIDSRPLPTMDTSIEIEVSGNASRFTTPGSGMLIARVSFASSGPTLFFPWQVNVDQIVWQIPN